MRWLVLGMLAAGCGPAEENVCSGEPARSGVISDLRFARAEEGVSVGFDLDEHTTTQGANLGCGIADYTSPEGTTGIDNALAAVIPALELTEAVAAEAIIHDAINSGELLLMFALGGYEGADDTCTDFRFYRGEGDPMVGTDGDLVSGQTFDVDASVPEVTASGVALNNGSSLITDLSITIPLQIFDADLNLQVDDVSMQLDLAEDGSFSGYMGGTFDYWQIIDMAQSTNVDQALADSMPALFGAVADMAPDENGVCQKMSVTLEFDGVSAYNYPETNDSL